MKGNRIALITALLLAVNMTACSSPLGKKEDSSSVGIKVKEGTLKSEESKTDSEMESDDIYVPNIKINFNEEGTSGFGSSASYNLSQFSIIKKDASRGTYGYGDDEEYEYDIADLQLSKLTEDLGLEMNEYYSTITSTEMFYYTAIGYTGKANPTSRDSVFAVEIEINGEVVDDYDVTNISNYKVKGIKFTKNLIDENDYEIKMLGGYLAFGMSRDSVRDTFGKGYQGEGDDSNHIYYRVSDAVMVLEFNSNALDTVYYIKT